MFSSLTFKKMNYLYPYHYNEYLRIRKLHLIIYKWPGILSYWTLDSQYVPVLLYMWFSSWIHPPLQSKPVRLLIYTPKLIFILPQLPLKNGHAFSIYINYHWQNDSSVAGSLQKLSTGICIHIILQLYYTHCMHDLDLSWSKLIIVPVYLCIKKEQEKCL